MAEEALRVLVEEKLCERADAMGKLMRDKLEQLKDKHPNHVRRVGGRAGGWTGG